MARAPRQKAVEQAESLARRIWLAGLGAYGQSLEDAQQHLDRAGGEASRLFQDLVEKGQRIEEQSRSGIRKSIDDARSAISGHVGSNARSVEEMIRRVRDKVGLDAALTGRLDALARRVDGLAQALGLPSMTVTEPAAAPARATPKAKPRARRAATPKAPAVKRSAAAPKPARAAAKAVKPAARAGKAAANTRAKPAAKPAAKPRPRRAP
jgi:poly(hydroxyalkanoate) granule-associated protein